MQHDTEPDHHADSGREQLPEGVPGIARDTEAEPDERAEQQRDREHAEEAPLLANGRENEIGVRVWQVAELLLALSESGAEQLPRPDTGERLLYLPRGFLGCRAGVQECQHPRDSVLRGGDGTEQQRSRSDTEGEEMPNAGPRGKEHA